jgi:hypothetical protein
MSMMGTPHPEHEIAARLARLEARSWPSVMIWKPLVSISGMWEAAGPDWVIIEEDPVKFADELARRIGIDAPGLRGAGEPLP